MNTTFYMVFLEGQRTPEYMHQTFEDAEKEAKRLAGIHNKKAFVLVSVRSYQKLEFVERDLRPDSLKTDELPF